MSEQSTMEKLAEKFSVKVIKPVPDTRVSIAGSEFIPPGHEDHDGESIGGELVAYAVIPAHAADSVKPNNKHYIYGEPFLAEVKKKPMTDPT